MKYNNLYSFEKNQNKPLISLFVFFVKVFHEDYTPYQNPFLRILIIKRKS